MYMPNQRKKYNQLSPQALTSDVCGGLDTGKGQADDFLKHLGSESENPVLIADFGATFRRSVN